jgi:hypothetical protein
MTPFYSFIRYVLNSTIRPEWMTPSFSTGAALVLQFTELKTSVRRQKQYFHRDKVF